MIYASTIGYATTPTHRGQPLLFPCLYCLSSLFPNEIAPSAGCVPTHPAEDTREVYDLSNQWTSAGNEPDLSGARQFRWQFSPNA